MRGFARRWGLLLLMTGALAALAGVPPLPAQPISSDKDQCAECGLRLRAALGECAKPQPGDADTSQEAKDTAMAGCILQNRRVYEGCTRNAPSSCVGYMGRELYFCTANCRTLNCAESCRQRFR